MDKEKTGGPVLLQSRSKLGAEGPVRGTFPQEKFGPTKDKCLTLYMTDLLHVAVFSLRQLKVMVRMSTEQGRRMMN